MSTCAKCIYKPFCKSAGYVCSSFKDKENFVEVVRCKDCVFLERTDAFGDCTLYDEHVSKYPNDYCSDGKRKDQTRT